MLTTCHEHKSSSKTLIIQSFNELLLMAIIHIFFNCRSHSLSSHKLLLTKRQANQLVNCELENDVWLCRPLNYKKKKDGKNTEKMWRGELNANSAAGAPSG